MINTLARSHATLATATGSDMPDSRQATTTITIRPNARAA